MLYSFGGDTQMTPEQIKRRREFAQLLMDKNLAQPKNVPEGLNAIARALVARGTRRMTDKAEETNRSEFARKFGSLFGGSGGMYGGTPANPPSPYDAMYPTGQEGPAPKADGVSVKGQNYAFGQEADPEWERIQAGIFAGESGGDYDALFGFSQRPGKKFEGVKPTQMTVGEVLQLQDPSGQYGQWVKGQVGRVATPVGAYQIVGTTLRDAVRNGVVSPDEQFSPEVQDRVGKWILSTQGTGAWEGYRGPQEPGSVQVAQAGGGFDIGTMAELAASPYASEGQKLVLQALIDRQLQASDPMYRLSLENQQLQNEKLRNPQAEFQIKELADGRSYYVDPTGRQPARLVNPDIDPAAAGGTTEYGLTPQYVTRPDGTLGMVQLSKDGTAKEVDLPEGLALQKGIEKLDLGTHFQWYNTMTGEAIGQPIPKQLREAEAEKSAGRVEGEAEAQKKLDAPGTIAQADETIRLIDQVLNDPALPSVVGKWQGRMDPEGWTGLAMSQEALNLMPKIEQLQGKAFLQAFENLKGGGQITEREGQAATAAITRLGQRYVDDATYKEALNDLKRIASNAKARAAGEEVPEYIPEWFDSAETSQGGEPTPSAQPASVDINSDTPPAGLSEDDADLWKYATPEERKAIWGQQ